MAEGRLKSCPRCGRSFGPDARVCAYDETPLTVAAETDPEWAGPDDERTHQVGDQIGPYRLLDQVGAGGMGVIYRAEHLRIGREVALKLLRPDLAQQPESIRRFFLEARAVNEIRHANIVDIVDLVEDFGVNPPLVFMVMELLRGTNLDQHLRANTSLGAKETIAIALQIADALGAAHDVLIVHRDVKPENIFLVPRAGDSGPLVKLLDFGVVKAFGQREPSTELTRSGTLIGTPEYMAPEHALDQELNERTDIYSLGLVIYEMLAGTVPFRAEGYVEVLMRQVKERPAPIASHGRDPVPPELEAVVMRCLEKRPQDRFRTMAELRQALLGCLGPPPVPAPPAIATAPGATARGSLPAGAPPRPDDADDDGGQDDDEESRPTVRRRRVTSLTTPMPGLGRVAGRRPIAIIVAIAVVLLGLAVAFWALASPRPSAEGPPPGPAAEQGVDRGNPQPRRPALRFTAGRVSARRQLQ